VFKTIPEANHYFLTDPKGRYPLEPLSSLAVRKDVLGTLADWLSTALH
jgi:hypothetical protein